MNVLRQHVAALSDQADLISEPARQQLQAISRALEGDRCSASRRCECPASTGKPGPRRYCFAFGS